MHARQAAFIRDRDAALERLRIISYPPGPDREKPAVQPAANTSAPAEPREVPQVLPSRAEGMRHVHASKGPIAPVTVGVVAPEEPEVVAPVAVDDVVSEEPNSEDARGSGIASVLGGVDHEPRTVGPAVLRQDRADVDLGVLCGAVADPPPERPEKKRQPMQATSPVFSIESDAESFDTAADRDLPTLCLEDGQMTQADDEPVVREDRTVRGGIATADEDVLRGEEALVEEGEVSELGRDGEYHSVLRENGSDDIDDEEFSNWHASRSRPAEGNVETGGMRQVAGGEATKPEHVVEEARSNPPTLTMHDIEHGKSLLSLPSENLEESVSSRRTPVRGQSQVNTASLDDEYSLSADLIPLRSTTEISLENTPPLNSAGPPHCFDCDAWRGRVEELQTKVEQLTIELSGREIECASLRAKCSGKIRPPTKNEARLRQECASLRVTTEFLVSLPFSTYLCLQHFYNLGPLITFYVLFVSSPIALSR